jgi:prefoldin beta subunit
MAYQFPKELQDKISNFEQIKNQLQVILSQKAEMEAKRKEIRTSLEALNQHEEGDIFRRVGDLLLKVDDKKSLVNEMEEEAETLDVRIKSMGSQEKSLREMYEKLGKEINESLKG